MFRLKSAISLLVAAGLSVGGMLAAGDQVRAKVRNTAQSAVQLASEVVADLQAEAGELVQTAEVRAGSQSRIETSAGGQPEANNDHLNLNSEAQAEAESDGSLEIEGPFDVGSWITLNLFGEADGGSGW